MRQLILLTLVSLLCFGGSKMPVPATMEAARLDSLFDALSKDQLMMGSITVTRHGEEIYSGELGYKEVSSFGKAKADRGSKYRIGSVSKIFTAALIFQLIEEGQLSLDTKLSAFYPGIPQSDSITIGQMLNHHSGLPHFHFVSEIEQIWNAGSEEEVIRIIASEPHVSGDRVDGAYSNANYLLLGFIIEKITKISYESHLQKRIFDELDLSYTYYKAEQCEAEKNEAYSYHFVNSRWQHVPQHAWQITEGSGLLVSNPDDMAVFMNSLFAGKIINKNSLAQMTDVLDHFGYGLHSVDFNDKKGFGLTGKIEGYLSALIYFPGEELCIALAINGHVYPMNDILIAVLSIVFGEESSMLAFESVELDKNEITGLTGEFYSPDFESKMTLTQTIDDKGSIRLRVSTTNDLLGTNMPLEPLSPTRFLQRNNGAIIDFEKDEKGKAISASLTVWGSRVPLEKL